MIISEEMLRTNCDCEILKKTMIIYKFENLYDGNIYIGQTMRIFKARIQEHILHSCNSKKASYFERALNKYGIENFDVSIVAECETKEKLNELEKFYISFFDCKFPNGYNLTAGGSGYTYEGLNRPTILKYETKPRGSQRKRKTRCIETETIFESVTAAAKWAGVPQQDITRACTGIIKCAAGLHWEYCDRLDESNVAKIFHKRAVICLENGKIFESIKAAAKWADVDGSTILKALKGKKSVGGFHFKYVEEPVKNSKRPIICIENNKEFESIRAAAKWANISKNTINDALHGKNKTAAGFHWKYLTNETAYCFTKKAVVCEETKMLFESITAAAEWAGVSKNTVCNALHGKLKTAAGYHWQYADQKEEK